MSRVKFSCVDTSSMICASGSRERDVKRGILARIIILNLDSLILTFEDAKKKTLVYLQITFLLAHFRKGLIFFIS
jgi:hypothetical protein